MTDLGPVVRVKSYYLDFSRELYASQDVEIMLYNQTHDHYAFVLEGRSGKLESKAQLTRMRKTELAAHIIAPLTAKCIKRTFRVIARSRWAPNDYHECRDLEPIKRCIRASISCFKISHKQTICGRKVIPIKINLALPHSACEVNYKFKVERCFPSTVCLT